MESQQSYSDGFDSDEFGSDELPPPPVHRVRLMCSYAGRIQSRSHDDRLSYVGGETKILTVPRSVTFKPILARIAAFLSPAAAEDVCFKYQLPGEDLDSLISVTNDEDLEHMMLEYDRLLRPGGAAAPRLRLFVFPLGAAGSISIAPMQNSERQWFVDALNSVSVPIPPPPTQAEAVSPAVVTQAIQGIQNAEEMAAVAAENQKQQAQIQGLQRLQIAAERLHQQAQMEELERLQIAAEKQHRQAQIQEQQRVLQIAVEKATKPMPPAVIWPEQRVSPEATMYAPVAGGEQPMYIISGPREYPYYAAVPRMVTAEAYSMAVPPPPAVPRMVTAEAYSMAPPAVPRMVTAAAYSMAAPSPLLPAVPRMVTAEAYSMAPPAVSRKVMAEAYSMAAVAPTVPRMVTAEAYSMAPPPPPPPVVPRMVTAEAYSMAPPPPAVPRMVTAEAYSMAPPLAVPRMVTAEAYSMVAAVPPPAVPRMVTAEAYSMAAPVAAKGKGF